MNQYGYSKHKDFEEKRFKFYKHLKVYLIFVGFMLFISVFMDSDVNFYPVAFWWGLGVVFHYLKTYGWQHLTMDATRFETGSEQQEELHLEKEEEVVELKKPQRAWRDRDLV